MKQGKKVNGNVNIDTPEMEDMRRYVIEQELVARSWKAQYEKMHYALECDKIRPAYEEYQKQVQEKMEEGRKQMEAFQKALQEELDKQNAENPVGEIQLEEVK